MNNLKLFRGLGASVRLVAGSLFVFSVCMFVSNDPENPLHTLGDICMEIACVYFSRAREGRHLEMRHRVNSLARRVFIEETVFHDV